MSTAFDFDQVDVKTQKAPVRPLFTVQSLENDSEVMKWLKNAYEVIMESDRERQHIVKENFELYKGAHGLRGKEATPRTQEYQKQYKKSRDRLIINYLYDLTEQQIARMTRYKPAVAIEPSNDEYEDKIAANTTKLILDDIWYRNSIDSFITRFHRRSRIAGEDYLVVTWDPDAGDLHPSAKEAQKAGIDKVEKVDPKTGEPILSEAGEQEFISTQIKSGEVKYELLSTRKVLQEPGKLVFEDLNYVILLRTRDVDELKKEHPDKAHLIKVQSTQIAGFDEEAIKNMELRNETLTLELLHRKNKYIPEGRRILATLDCILSNEILPYKHGRLPLLRLTDIDDEDAQHAYSYFANLEQLQNAYNNSSTMIMQNQRQMAYPKWLVPKGTINIEALGNDRTIVQYKGAQPPTQYQPNPTSPEVFNFREGLKGEMRQLGGGTEQDRGEPPPGITAGVALQYLDEQVTERFSTYIQKHNRILVDLAKLTLETASQYYQDDDGRLERILGKNNVFALERFRIEDLARPYNIRIQNASALPDSKAAKIQTIIDLKKEFPDLFTSEQVVELIELGSSKQYMNQATMAIKAAQSENEDMKQGAPVEEPLPHENLMLHWKTHVMDMQDRSYRSLPEPVRFNFEDHVEATELLMFEAAGLNPAFAQQLLTLPQFPIFYKPSIQELAIINPQAAAQMMAAEQAMMPLGGDLAGIGAFEGAPEEMPLEVPPLEPQQELEADMPPNPPMTPS